MNDEEDLVCVECGDNLAAAGYRECLDCLEAGVPATDRSPTEA